MSKKQSVAVVWIISLTKIQQLIVIRYENYDDKLLEKQFNDRSD
jgi:hypothetical protein